jgi:hypothetical protein
MPSDVFQWKDSSSTTSSVGMGTKLSLVSDDTQRDVTQTRDYLQQLLRPGMLDKLEGIVSCYDAHFACKVGEDGNASTSISMEHREYIRGLTDDLYDRAKNKLLDKYIDDEQKLADAERLKLENLMCELYPKLNGVGGSTRNSFAQTVIAHTLHENNVAITGLLTQLRHDAITRETDALQGALDRSMASYIEADDKDYAKYLGAQQLLRGAWNKIDYTDDTDESIDRDIRDFTLTGQWNRTAGSISGADGSYAGDQDAINTFGNGIPIGQ